jgi:hypothetical protein
VKPTILGAEGPPAAVERLAMVRQRDLEHVLTQQLPLWPDSARGAPNWFLRSALFGAFRRGSRRYMTHEHIASVSSVSIFYTGQQLDQSDLDVWLGLLHLLRGLHLGEKVEISEKEFLRFIDRGGVSARNIGKSDREWLRRVLVRLQATTVEVTGSEFSYNRSLISSADRDHVSGRWIVTVDRRIRGLFGRGSWTQIDWNIRCALRGHPLAQWLHGFYSTHASPIPYKVETLLGLCGSEAGAQASTLTRKALADWKKQSLMPALDALKEANQQARQSFSWRVDGQLVIVDRMPSPAQQRHLQKLLSRGTRIDWTARGDGIRNAGG